MKERVSYRIVGNDIVRRIYVKGRGPKTSKLPIPSWADRSQELVDLYDLAWLASTERPRVRASDRVIRAVDLFCGCGGLTLGVREAARGLGCGFQSVFASDNNAVALSLYQRNFLPLIFDGRPIEKSVDGELGMPQTPTEMAFCEKIGDIDILVAGPPCQGNSNLNNYTRRDDPKNLLYLRAVRCAELLRPPALIIENVPGVYFEKHGVLQRADEYLREIGYKVSFGVLPMWKFGVPQMRRRMILVASRVMENVDIEEFVKQSQIPPRPLSWACGDLLDKYKVGDPFDSSSIHSPINQARIHYLFEHDLHELPDDQRPDCHRLKPHTYPSVYGRMWWDRPAPTLTCGFACCGRGRFVHPLRERTLTPHEAARVQFFPDFFDFSGLLPAQLQRAIGNAVPAKAGYVVSLPLLKGILEAEALQLDSKALAGLRSGHGDIPEKADASDETLPASIKTNWKPRMEQPGLSAEH